MQCRVGAPSEAWHFLSGEIIGVRVKLICYNNGYGKISSSFASGYSTTYHSLMKQPSSVFRQWSRYESLSKRVKGFFKQYI